MSAGFPDGLQDLPGALGRCPDELLITSKEGSGRDGPRTESLDTASPIVDLLSRFSNTIHFRNGKGEEKCQIFMLDATETKIGIEV